jgi:hypothetical protein
MPEAPWDFSEPPADGEGVPNVSTPLGRALGAELARLCDLEEPAVRERFPGHARRCNDCAFRAGTDPNGCAETLMDAVKGLIEGVPFYCHKGFDESGRPTRLCAGWAICVGTDAPLRTIAAAVAPHLDACEPAGEETR